MTLHHTRFNKESKWLRIEKINMKSKKTTKKWNSKVDAIGVGPSVILKLHLTTGDVLSHSITEQELEKVRLKKSISELEDALSPRPLFVEPLSIVVPEPIS